MVQQWKAQGYRHFAEVGVFHGKFSAAILKIIEDSIVVSIDRWRNKDGTRNNTAISYALTRLEPYGHRSQIVVSDSVLAARMFPDRFFDVVYIDADHSLDGASRDLGAWLSKVRHGGLLAGHDYGRMRRWRCNVTNAVNEFARTTGMTLYLTRRETRRRSLNWWFYVN
jgi:predicted O-methyltransferase YrrM